MVALAVRAKSPVDDMMAITDGTAGAGLRPGRGPGWAGRPIVVGERTATSKTARWPAAS